MSRKLRDDYKGPLVGSFGWLFADLLLVLSMIFLLSNAVAYPQRSKTSTVTPETKATAGVQASPSLPPPLYLQPNCLTLHLANYNDLLGKKPLAIQNVKDQVNRQIAPFKNLQAGFIQIYGGALPPSDIGTALNIADAIKDILETYDTLFQRNLTTYHQSFYHPNMSPNEAIIEVYLYSTNPNRAAISDNVNCSY